MKKNLFVLIALALMVFFGVGTVMAADAKTQTRFITGFNIAEPVNSFTPYVIYNYCNFADLTTGSATGVTGGDVVQMLKIPAGTYIKSVGAMISTKWTTTGATCYPVTIGDGNDAKGWIREMDWGPSASGVSTSAGNTNWSVYAATLATGVTTMIRPEYFKSGGSYYKSADTIDAVIPVLGRTADLPGGASGLTDFVLKIWAEAIKMPAQYNYRRKN
jgi:hypothetical protein